MAQVIEALHTLRTLGYSYRPGYGWQPLPKPPQKAYSVTSVSGFYAADQPLNVRPDFLRWEVL